MLIAEMPARASIENGRSALMMVGWKGKRNETRLCLHRDF